MALGAASSAVLTGVVVTTGRWAEGKELSMKIVVGATFLAVSLSVLSEINPLLGGQFALLVLTVAVLRYALPILEKSGLVKK